MKTNYLASTPRTVDIVAGAVLAVADLLLALVIGVLLHRVLVGKTLPGAVWIIAALALVALGAALLSWRLLSGQRRRTDGGLLSPFVLRSASLIFLLGAVLSAWAHSAGFLDIFGAVGAASACFVLARYREQVGARGQSDSAPIEPK